MAKKAIEGIVISVRRGKRVQHNLNETIVEVEEGADPAALIAAKVLWTREGGFRIVGRIVGRHGRGRAVRVRWRTGFPPQGIGTPAQITAK